MSQTVPSPASRALKSAGRTIRWFYYNGWKLLLGLLLVVVVCYSLTTYLLERRFVAEIATLRAQGQPVTAADLVRPAVPDRQNGAIVLAKAFKLLESKDGDKAADTLKLMMAGRRRVAGKGKPDAAMPQMPVLPQPNATQGVWVMPPMSSAQRRFEKGLMPWPEVLQAAKQVAGVVPITRDALSRPDCHFPMVADPHMVNNPKHYANIRTLVGVLSALAVVDAHDGKVDQAYEKIGLAFKTAQVNYRERSFMNIIITMSCVEIASNGLQKVLEYGIPTPAQADQLNRVLTGPKLQSQFVNALQGERALNLTMISSMYNLFIPNGLKGVNAANPKNKPSGDSMLGFFLRPVAYLDGLTSLRLMSQSISIAKMKYPSAKQQDELDKIGNRMPRYAPMSYIIAGIFTTGVMKPHATRAKTALTQILLAAQQYKASHGQYPDTMAQVRSAGVADIPIDPFTGKDFVYKRTAKGFTVYSMGEDFKDDGGKSKSERRRSEDGWDIVLKWEREGTGGSYCRRVPSPQGERRSPLHLAGGGHPAPACGLRLVRRAVREPLSGTQSLGVTKPATRWLVSFDVGHQPCVDSSVTLAGAKHTGREGGIGMEIQNRKRLHIVIEALICVAILAGLATVLVPIFLGAQDLARSANTQERAKLLGDALKTYCLKNDGHLPPADRWCDALQPHIAPEANFSLHKWQCNGTNTEPYAMVRALGGVNLKNIKDPGKSVVFFEITVRKPNVSGDLQMQVPPHGERRWNVVVMADGHRKLVKTPTTGTR